jgi:hypothetical protein
MDHRPRLRFVFTRLNSGSWAQVPRQQLSWTQKHSDRMLNAFARPTANRTCSYLQRATRIKQIGIRPEGRSGRPPPADLLDSTVTEANEAMRCLALAAPPVSVRLRLCEPSRLCGELWVRPRQPHSSAIPWPRPLCTAFRTFSRLPRWWRRPRGPLTWTVRESQIQPLTAGELLAVRLLATAVR